MLQPQLESDLPRRWFRLLAVVAVIAALWLLLLPMVGSQSDIRAYIDRNEKLGIDPGAKFYTELPGMPIFLDQIESARRRHDSAFWPAGSSDFLTKIGSAILPTNSGATPTPESGHSP